MNKHEHMVSLYGGDTPNQAEMAASKLTKKSIFEVVNNYRRVINLSIDRGDLDGAIRTANYLKIYLERTKETLKSCQN